MRVAACMSLMVIMEKRRTYQVEDGEEWTASLVGR
jgi:hypothetical protein